MTDEQTILDSAKYLREVRPIDPEEVSDYVEGGVHPAVVRRILRAHAFELGVVERSDGRFVPVPDGPLPGPGPGRRPEVTALPEAYSRALEDLLVETYGPDWHRGDSGDRLRETVRRLKEDYYRNREVEYDRDVALGYAIYHLADFYAAVQHVLWELTADGLLDRRLRILDVGAGVGGPALGIHDAVFGPPAVEGLGGTTTALGGAPADDDYDGQAGDAAPETPPARVDYHAVEPSAAADVFERLADRTDANFEVTVHRTTAEAFDPGEVVAASDPVRGDDQPPDSDPAPTDGFDLILFANVLSELADPAAVTERYLDWLAPDGSLVAMAPADRETAVGLREVERALERDAGATVYSPEVRLWPDRTPTDEGWSFAEAPPVEAPAVQRKLDEQAGSTGEFTKTEVRYAYSILRLDGRRRLDFRPDAARFAPLADSEDHVTDRIDLVALKLSRDLSEGEDANPLFRVGDGSQDTDHYAVLVNETALNGDLVTAEYGDLLVFEGVLVLFNDDEGAYNLVVDEETIVDRFPAGA